jgi:nitrite reductase/ring-hydroxylating ferredoxin subunit
MMPRTSLAPQPEPLFRVGPYLRVVAASVERVWENVLDWEHLPYLHNDSFSAIRLLESGAQGWRALVTSVASLGGTESEIEVRIDRPDLSYVTRTLEGIGAGTEIVTKLTPVDGASTRIEVDFLVPGVSEEHADLVGVFYRRLYARLWDQDEAMMVERERALARASARVHRVPDDRRAPVPLGDARELKKRLPLLVEIADRTFRIVELEGAIVVHSATCPHMCASLTSAVVEHDGCITCPWHGYRFDIATGRSADGRKLKLAPAPRVDVDAATGEAFLRWRI